MKLKIESYDSHDLDDASYKAYIPRADMSFLNLTPATLIDVSRGMVYPHYAGKVMQGKQFTIDVEIKGTLSTSYDTLKQWFNPIEQDLKTLLFTDQDDSKQWYLMCTCIANPVIRGNWMSFTMYAPEPVLLSNTQNSSTWSITASGQTKAITADGNAKTHPIFEITPTGIKSGGYDRRRFRTLYNTTTDPFTDYPYDICEGGWDTDALINYATNQAAINSGGGIAADTVTIPYDGEVGTLPSAGIGMIEDEQISWTGKSGGNLTGVTRGINGTTAAVHADDAVIYQSKLMANGYDIRVMVDGVEVPRWISGLNTANTKVWINVSLKPKQETALITQISDSGTLTTITFDKKSNTFLKSIAPVNGRVLIDSEVFTYTAVNTSKYQLTGVTPAAKGTSRAVHAVGATVRWLEHDIWLLYSNSAAEDPDQNDEKEPVFNQATSTNTSWDYDNFADVDQLRTGSWKPSVIHSSGKKSEAYRDNQGADAETATELGMKGLCYQANGVWKAESFEVEWRLDHPMGITHVTSSGEKYMHAASWPNQCNLEKLITARRKAKWIGQWTQAKPTTKQTWEAWTKSAQSLSGTFRNIRFVLGGSISASANNEVDFEVGDVTLTLDSTREPGGGLLAEDNNYYIDALITNNTTAEWIRLTYLMYLDEKITIDCENKTVLHEDGTNAGGALTFSSVRAQWLDLSPGSNTLQFDDTGTSAVTFVIKHRDRNA